jgi:DNA-binding beta-propeller fold protein YncE/cytochrome c peroxidase
VALLLTACPSGGEGNNGGDDNTPPTIGTLQLQNAADSNITAAKILVLQVTAQDDTELAKVEFFQGNTKIGEDPSAPYEQSVPLTRDNNGSLSFTAKAVDKAENESALSNAVSVTVNIALPTLVRPSKSSAIAITGNDKLVVQVNPENDSISTFDAATNKKLKELPVGDEPVAVVIHPDDDTAFVALRAEHKIVKVTGLGSTPTIADEVEVGSEPTGIALSPTGSRLVVAEFAEGHVSLINTETMSRIGDGVDVRNPRAVAITNDNDEDDTDERVIVTEFYGRPIAKDKEAKDDSRTGAVQIFELNSNSLESAGEVLFEPVAVTEFAPTTVTSPNQLYSVAIAGDKFFVTATAASSDGAPAFNQNIYQLVLVGNVKTGQKLGVINLSEEIKKDVPANRIFMADIVDVSLVGNNILYFVSRGGDGFQRAVLTGDSSVTLGDDGNTNVKQVDLLAQRQCQNPIGVVTAHDVTDNKFAYVNCWVSRSMVTVGLATQTAINTEPSAAPAAGNDAAINKGRRFYFTGRGRWSNEAWSSCASCHPDGLSDNITWRFPSGPRQSTSMDSTFSHTEGASAQKQRILNWTAIFDQVHAFERNTRAVSGGKGAITSGNPTCIRGDLNSEKQETLNPADPNGAQEDDLNGVRTNLTVPVKELQDNLGNALCTVALDNEKDWDLVEAFVRTIRPPSSRQFLETASVLRGRDVFSNPNKGNCVECHGGQGWTVSRLFYAPSVAENGRLAATDTGTQFPGHTRVIQPELVGTETRAPFQVACVLRAVGTFGNADLEKKQPIAGVIGAAQGEVSGYNVPGLYGLQVGAPFLHHGQAQSLEELFTNPAYSQHLVSGNNVFAPSTQDVTDLVNFLLSIDATTDEFAIPAGEDKCAQFEN